LAAGLQRQLAEMSAPRPGAPRSSSTWLAALSAIVLAGCGAVGPVEPADGPPPATHGGDVDGNKPKPPEVTVAPARTDALLVNPNMGLADFHFGWWCNLPPITFTPEQCAERVRANHPQNHPPTGVAYFRWQWRDLEPVRGEVDFRMIDYALQTANLLGQTLAFRVMLIRDGAAGVPDWLRAPPYSVPGIQHADGTFWPDYRSPIFQAEHRRLLAMLGARYDDHPAVDHIDIGTVGCWGEWNTACLSGVDSIIEIFSPQSDAERDEIAAGYRKVIDDHVQAFPTTPVVMLGTGGEGGRQRDLMVHALESGTGWRVDCWGDWRYFSTNWSHQSTLYPRMIEQVTAAYPAFGEVWKHAPVQLEVCGTMPQWEQRGWTTDAPDGDVYKTFQWALEVHAAVLNAKRTPIPEAYGPALKELLIRNGYRYVVDRLVHPERATAGGALVLDLTWSNLGVTPSYTRRTVSYRLRGEEATHTVVSAADVRTWLPGTWTAQELLPLPADLPPGTYALEVAILDRPGTFPTTAPLPPLQLGMAGRGEDGWYTLSSVIVDRG
jgi:hypothetical protein